MELETADKKKCSYILEDICWSPHKWSSNIPMYGSSKHHKLSFARSKQASFYLKMSNYSFKFTKSSWCLVFPPNPSRVHLLLKTAHAALFSDQVPPHIMPTGRRRRGCEHEKHGSLAGWAWNLVSLKKKKQVTEGEMEQIVTETVEEKKEGGR